MTHLLNLTITLSNLHRYTALTPELYGDPLDNAVGRLYFDPISTMQLGTYEMSNVSILLHRFGPSPDTSGIFTVRNRMLGQLPGSANNATSCSEDRCNETYRPFPCACGDPVSLTIIN